MAFVPTLAALILIYRGSGVSGAKTFLRRALDYRRIRGVGWVATAVLLMPLVFLLAYTVLRLEGRALPGVQFFSIAAIVAFTLMFFIGAIGEELGWQGYAYAGVKNGRSALAAALILGAVWGLWHVIPFIEMGRSVDWTLWQCLGAIALRVVIVWSPLIFQPRSTRAAASVRSPPKLLRRIAGRWRIRLDCHSSARLMG